MPDLASISTILSSIKTATDLAKLIKGSDLSLKDAEVKLQLAELISALADAKIEFADVQIEMQSKDKEIDLLTSKLEQKERVTWEKPYYWLGDKEENNGPFCQCCYDDKDKLIRLKSNTAGMWHCL